MRGLSRNPQDCKFDGSGSCVVEMGPAVALAPSGSLADPDAKWIKDIDNIGKLDAEIIIPGHQRPGMQFDTSSLDFTRKYLRATDEDLTGIPSAAEFHSAMIKRFPKANLVYFLDMNARVLNNDWNWREEP